MLERHQQRSSEPTVAGGCLRYFLAYFVAFAVPGFVLIRVSWGNGWWGYLFMLACVGAAMLPMLTMDDLRLAVRRWLRLPE